MKPLGRVVLENLTPLLGLFTIMVLPSVAQPLTSAPSPAAAASDVAPGGTVIIAVILGLLVAIGFAVKLSDVKRRREDEAAALQGRISDALMTDRSLANLALTPSIRVPFGRNGVLGVTVSGAVPTPELREAAIQLVMRKMEESRTNFRIEDRVVVDPLMSRH